MERSLVWVKDGGAELARVKLTDRRLSATGTAIGSDPLPYRLDYTLRTVDRFVTSALYVSSAGHDPDRGPWRRQLELRHDGAGTWTVDATGEGDPKLPPPGGDPETLRDALDCDLGLSPLTNTMPVLRAGLLAGGGPVDFVMAWVSVPDLAVVPDRQTYTFRRRDGDHPVINYTGGDWTRDIVFDAAGLVLDYPDIGRRVA
ncbi:putative glycolipid-binding domain-containing protein [Microlunatus speluncae]|uniref:putative glycolipid-binding domain-containing protein n=1 Tax=Microlunatus speluncae TaxID=2594267 RepID=UPI0012665979|nr:putative glycolipid-binding domain-containing protein [Microlunatus speluncae]